MNHPAGAIRFYQVNKNSESAAVWDKGSIQESWHLPTSYMVRGLNTGTSAAVSLAFTVKSFNSVSLSMSLEPPKPLSHHWSPQ